MSDYLAFVAVVLVLVIVFGPEVKRTPPLTDQETQDGANEYNSRHTLPGHPPTCDCPACEESNDTP